MDKEKFNEYLDNLMVEAKVEYEMSEFTQQVNQIISQTEFDESKQAFLFISIDNMDKPEPDAFISHVGNAKGCNMILQAVKNVNKTNKHNDDKEID